MPHLYTHKDSAVAAVLLPRTVVQVDESQPSLQQLGKLVGCLLGLVVVGRTERIVVEGHAVDDGHKEEGPVRAAFREIDVLAVVDGEEDMGGAAEVRERRDEGEGVGGLHEHEGHAGPEEDDVGVSVFGEEFSLEVSAIVGQVFSCERGSLAWRNEEHSAYSSQKDMDCKARGLAYSFS